jgi:hypothetical protein
MSDDVLRVLGRIEGTLTSFIASNNERIATIERDVKETQDDVSALENQASRWIGKASVVGVCIGLVGGYIMKYIPFIPKP